MARGIRLLLRCAVCVPFMYFGTLLVSATLFPGYRHTTQYASELGSAAAPYPWVFNSGIILTGLAGLAASVGLARAATALGGSRVLGALTGVFVGLFSVSIIMAALFPMPDPRHAAFGLGIAIQAAPFLLAAAIWRVPALRQLRTILLIVGVAMTVLFAIMMGVGAMVTRANVGLFQRAYALTTFPWIGVAGFVLARHLRARG